MAIPLLAIGLAIAAAAGAAKSITGAKQAKEGRDLARNNQRPDFDIAQEYFTNQDLAQSMAQSGLPQASLNYYQQQAYRGLTSSTDALLRAGGGPNAIAGIYDQYNQGIGAIASQDAMARTQNIRYLIDQNKAVAEQEAMRWGLNEYETYKDRAQTATALQAQGTQNIFGGITDVAGAFIAGGRAGLYQKPPSNPPGQYSYAGNADQQVGQMNAYNDYRFGTAMGNPNASSIDPELFQRNQLIEDSLQSMENSPYQDLIRRQMQQQYGIFNRGTIE